MTSVASLSHNWQAASVALREPQTENGLTLLNTGHPCDALISLVVPNPYWAEKDLRDLAKFGQMQAYVVTESVALAIGSKPGPVEGFCQVALLKKPVSLSYETFLQRWLGDHTQVAIETQSTFGYRQNIVAFSLPLAAQGQSPWPIMDAIVEENFPANALGNAEVFFDAVGDAQQLLRNQDRMNESCQRFIDFENFDCVPMSQTILK